MSETIFPTKTNRNFSFLFVIFSALIVGGCAVDAAKTGDASRIEKTSVAPETPIENASPSSSSAKNSITIEKDSPADTVRSFYKDLRAGKFRDALFLTNLRPAIEGLTDAELEDLQVDFANLARQIPADIEINGEIIVGKDATVTAKLPDNETDKMELQQIKLRRAATENVWTVQTLDDEAEKVVRRDGKNYFFNLKIQTHEREAKKMFDRIAKAQMVFISQNNGQYGDLPTLVAEGLLPEDALSSQSTGYNYKIALPENRKSYAVTAEPAVYGKSGKLSFGFTTSGGKTSVLKSEDRRGQPVRVDNM